MAAMSGDEEGLTRQLETLQGFSGFGPLPDGTRSVESAIAMIEGLFGHGGPIAMASAARRAVELETDGRSPHYAIANLALGHSGQRRGQPELGHQLVGEGATATLRRRLKAC